MAADSVTITFLADGSGAIREISDIGGEAVNLSNRLERVGDDMENALAPPPNSGKIKRVLKNISQEASEARGSINRMGAQTGRANQVLIEFGQGLGDAAYGIQGVANNIPILLTDFQRLIASTGSVTGAVSSLATATAGFGGIVLATQLIPLLAKAADGLDLFGDSAEDAEGDITALEERVQGLAESAVEAEGASDNIQAALSGLERDQLLELERQLASLQGRFQSAAGDPAFDIVAEITNSAFDTSSALAFTDENANQLFETIRTIGPVVTETLRQQVIEYRRSQEESTALRGILRFLGIEYTGLEESIEGVNREMDEMTVTTIDTSDVAQEASERIMETIAANQRMLNQMMNSIDEMRTGAVPLTELLQPSELDQAVDRIQQDLRKTAQEAGIQLEETGEKGANAGQIIQSSMGAAASAVRALRDDSADATDVLSVLLSSAATVFSAIPGFGLTAGILGGSGQLVGAFEHGGRVDTPFQIVGESGPELAMMPQGTQVASNETLNGALQQLARGGGMGSRIHITGTLRADTGEIVAEIDEERRINGRTGN